MNDCCNPECDGQSKMRRCGVCRRNKRFYCAAGCTTQVRNHFKVYCDDCAEFSHLRWHKEYQDGFRLEHREQIRINQRKNYRKRKALNNSLIIT